MPRKGTAAWNMAAASCLSRLFFEHLTEVRLFVTDHLQHVNKCTELDTETCIGSVAALKLQRMG